MLNPFPLPPLPLENNYIDSRIAFRKHHDRNLHTKNYEDRVDETTICNWGNIFKKSSPVSGRMKYLNELAYEQAPNESRKQNSASKASRLASPDHSQLAPLALDLTRLARIWPNREPVRRLERTEFHGDGQEAGQIHLLFYLSKSWCLTVQTVY